MGRIVAASPRPRPHTRAATVPYVILHRMGQRCDRDHQVHQRRRVIHVRCRHEGDEWREREEGQRSNAHRDVRLRDAQIHPEGGDGDTARDRHDDPRCANQLPDHEQCRVAGREMREGAPLGLDEMQCH